MLPRFYAILDHDAAAAAGWTVAALARACFDAGARLVQVRAKSLPSGELLRVCAEVARDASRFDAIVVVNDRADVAQLVSGGVHVGQDDLPPARARALVGPTAVVGFSTHSREQVIRALAEPISYLAVGPVFGTRTKDTGYDAVGLDLVRRAVTAAAGASAPGGAPLPVVAIGGITLETARSVIDAGASAVAVISDLLAGGDPSARVRAYLATLG
jgi:thiamine-phosphate pyrophosphorylase